MSTEHIDNSISYRDPVQWSKCMKEKISCGDQNLWSCEKTIMLAPKVLYNVRPEAYTPQLLFIGPLTPKHLLVGPLTDRSSMEPNTLSIMDRCKAEFVRGFFLRNQSGPQLDCLRTYLFEGDQNPLASYFEVPDYFQKEVLELLITVDSVFILEFLHNHSKYTSCTESMNEAFHKYLSFLMQRDLFIVGNQVSLSNLVRIAQKHNISQENLSEWIQKLISFRNPFTLNAPSSEPNDQSLLKCKHLLDCLYKACIKPKTSENANSSNDAEESCMKKVSELCKVNIDDGLCLSCCFKNRSEKHKSEKLPRASELRKAGVKFRAVIGNATDIRYIEKEVVVELPKLAVYDVTECTLRNMLAYEQTCMRSDDICSFILLMDHLIDNADDLEIFYRAGVLENRLGSDEKLIAMWNDMSAHVISHPNSTLTKISESILAHYDNTWYKMYVEFCRRYFSRPWYTLSLFAAVILLVMTVIQTVYTVMGYDKE